MPAHHWYKQIAERFKMVWTNFFKRKKQDQVPSEGEFMNCCYGISEAV
jgi:hypothetical protein